MRIAIVRSVRDDAGIFRRALEISVLLHLLLIFLLIPSVGKVWPVASSLTHKLALHPVAKEKPLRFELVNLPNDREQKPANPSTAPLSDRNRRAHGGQGRPNATRPGTHGNTPEIVKSQGTRFLGRGAPSRRARLAPRRQPRPPAQRRPTVTRPETGPESMLRRGAGERARPASPRRPAIQLPPPNAWALPPDAGGILEAPDRKGGSVDTGGLSFDTQWYNWGPYAAAMLRKIRRHWRIPEIARLGVQGVAKIRFYIERDGTVSGLRIIGESGKPPMDFAARDAIATSSPFEPLPKDLAGVDREGVTITFFYNMRPPDQE